MIFFFILIILINFFIVIYFDKISKLVNLFDVPDGVRKIHKKKTPLLGGSMFLLNLFLFVIYYFINNSIFNLDYFSTSKEIIIFSGFSLSFFLLGFFDDKFNLSANFKLISKITLIFFLICLEDQTLINELRFSFSINKINIENISYLFSVLCFLLFINAFNMFDGINLQSAIYSFFLFLIFLLKGIFIEISLVLLIVLLFFAYLNYKNKCFMGDNGTLLISFILSYFFIKSVKAYNTFSADEIFLIMLVPGLDLIRLFVTRILYHKHPFKGDNNHVHHILLKVFGLYKSLFLLFLLIIIPNILSMIYGGTLYLILISVIIYSSLIFFLNSYKKNY
jgi:UDP-GlcNAc:undecaprenyl-phosphate/decaprenyl-phosphate GlcNAc-1-phosphate transferase